jgi:hypothetical protein
MKGKHRHIDPKDIEKNASVLEGAVNSVSMDLKLQDQFNDLMDKLTNSHLKSYDKCKILDALCNLLASDHDFYDLIVKNYETICTIVKHIMISPQSKYENEYISANRLYCLMCMCLGADNDHALELLFPTLMDSLYFAYYPLTVQLQILQTIGISTLVCGETMDQTAFDFCFRIFQQLPMSDSADAMNHDSVLKIGALHCWSIIASSRPKEDICRDAEQYILDMLVLLIDNPNPNVVRLCGLVLAEVQEAALELGFSTPYNERQHTGKHVLCSESSDIYDCISLFNHSVSQFAVDNEHILSRISHFLNINKVPYEEKLEVHGGVISMHSFRVKIVMMVIRDLYQQGFSCILRSFPSVEDIVGWENIQFVYHAFPDDLPPAQHHEQFFHEMKHELQLQHQHAQEMKELQREKQEHPTVGVLPHYPALGEAEEAPPHHRKGRDNCYHLATGAKHGGSHIKHLIFGTYFAPKN